MYTVTIKLCLTEYHYLINCNSHGLVLMLQSMGEMSMVNMVTCIHIHFFETLNGAFEVQFHRASFYTILYHRH